MGLLDRLRGRHRDELLDLEPLEIEEEPPPPEPTEPGIPEDEADAPSPRKALAAAGLKVPDLRLLASVGTAGLPVWAFWAEAGDVYDWWRRLRAAHERTGLWPVLLGPSGDLGETWDTDGQHDGRMELARGEGFDFDTRLAEIAAYLAERDAPRGDPGGALATTERDLRFPSSDGYVGLIEAGAGYEVPGLVSWSGAANHMLEPADHVAILSWWQDLWRAELLGLGRAELELVVASPPSDVGDVLTVAQEQYRYCPEIVADAGNLDAFAARQVRGHAWYFWWD